MELLYNELSSKFLFQVMQLPLWRSSVIIDFRYNELQPVLRSPLYRDFIVYVFKIICTEVVHISSFCITEFLYNRFFESPLEVCYTKVRLYAIICCEALDFLTGRRSIWFKPGKSCDEGKSFYEEVPESPATKAYRDIVRRESTVISCSAFAFHRGISRMFQIDLVG